eukprot:g7699.t1
MSKLPVSAFIICQNEEAYLGACIESLKDFSEIVVVDSGSSDGTLALVRSYQQQGWPIRLIEEAWRGYASQKQFALDHCTQPWCFNIDSDERLDRSLQALLPQLVGCAEDIVGWRVARRPYLIGYGYTPPQVKERKNLRLIRKGRGSYDLSQAVHEGIVADGRVESAETGSLLHYRPLIIDEQILKENRYSTLKADQQFASGKTPSALKLVFSPPLYFARLYLRNGLWKCGRAGFIEAMTGAVLHIHFGKEGGAERFFVNLVNALHDRGVEQRMLIRPDRSWRSEIEPCGTIYEGVFRRISLSRFVLSARMTLILKEFQPDVIMSWQLRASRFMPNYKKARRVSRLGDYPEHLGYYTHSQTLVCITPDIAAKVRELGWTKGIEVIPNFTRARPSAPVDRAALETPEDAFVVVGMGRFVKRKGFDTLLRAVRALDGSYLWLLGDGPEKESLRALASELGILDRVRFPGWQTNAYAYLTAGDAFAITSLHEPLQHAMKVMHFHFGKDGGAERFFAHLVNALSRRGVEQISVIRPDRPWKKDITASTRIVESHFRNLSPDRLLLPLRVMRMAKTERPDAIMAWAPRASELMPAYGGCIKISRLGDYPTRLSYFRNTDVIVCNTPGIAAHVRTLGWDRRLEVISNFTDATAVAPASRADHDTPEGVPLVMSMGRFVRRKGFHTLIEAVAQLPDTWLWLAGEGEERQALEALASDKGVGGRIRFLGWQQDARPFLSAADVFVMPSTHEPLGNVILEAWAQGKPVVSSRSEGPLWFMREGENGLFADIEDAAGFARGIRLLLSDGTLASSVARGGRQTLIERFSEEAVSRSYMDLFGSNRR